MDLMECGRSCRLIKLFSIIESILLILFAFWGNILFLCGLPLSICGYIGSKKLNRIFLFLYVIFLLASIGFRIYLAYLYFTWLMIVLTVISEFLELYILKITISLSIKIPRLSNHDYRVLNQMTQSLF